MIRRLPSAILQAALLLATASGRRAARACGRTGGSTPRDEGSAAVELTVLTPVLVALLLLVVVAGRVTSAHLALQDAAQQAARTLTLSREPATALDQARAVARTAAGTAGVTCRQVDLTLEGVSGTSPSTSAAETWSPNASRSSWAGADGAEPHPVPVTVRLTCTVDLGDLTGLALPTSTTLTATSVVDRYRSDPREFANSEGSAGVNRSSGWADPSGDAEIRTCLGDDSADELAAWHHGASFWWKP